MRTIRVYFLIFFLLAGARLGHSQEDTTNADYEWTGTTEQKLLGLMTIWSEVKHTFPYFDQVPDVDWDDKVQEYIPRVIAAQDIDSYYKVLMEFVALLNDGHTGVNPPYGLFKPGFDSPPIEIQVVEEKFIITMTGDSDEMKQQKVYPGLEILEVGDAVPVKIYFQENVLRFSRRGTKQADEAINMWSIFSGLKDSKINLRVKDIDGEIRDVTLTRNSTNDSGEQFQCRMFQWYMAGSSLESKMLPDNILYVKIANFGNEQLVEDFHKIIDEIDLTSIKGMMIDIRHNPGGESSFAERITSFLIEQPIESVVWHIPYYSAADRAWGNEIPSREMKYMIKPVEGKKYPGPLVILTGGGTFSAAEDFVVPLQYSKRALLVGETTSGSTGNPLRVQLPGGGNFRVVTVRMAYPDGLEYVGIGVKPDIEVHPTIMDVYKSYDRVLAKGTEIIMSWKTSEN